MNNRSPRQAELADTPTAGHPAAFPWAVALAILAVTCLPYLIAWALTPGDLQFGGLLANPLDGNSYLAKMRLGADGQLAFYLTYSPDAPTPRLFYLPYLLWGFFTARVGLPLPTAYHLGRVLASLFFLWSAFRFLGRFATSPGQHRLAWLLVGISSGLGWLALPLGHIAPDLWVPEATSFYSIFTNVHFPLATGLMLWLVPLCTQPQPTALPRRSGMALACALGIALAQPYAAATAYAVIGATLAWQWLRSRRFPSRQVVVTAISAIPVALVAAYTFYVMATDPLIRAWSAQDVNPSPPPWDVALAYGVVGLLALGGAWRAWRAGERRLAPLVIWAAATLLLIYAPASFQRRLIMGLHVPLCGLAAYGLVGLTEGLAPARRRLATAGILGFSTLSNVVVILIALSGTLAHDHHYFFTRSEGEAMVWLHAAEGQDGAVLAAPSTSLFIPVYTGRQVVYGHPLETVQAAQRRAEVERFLRGEVPPKEEAGWLAAFRVQYILWGPAEKEMAGFDPAARPYLRAVFANEDVTVFRVHLPAR